MNEGASGGRSNTKHQQNILTHVLRRSVKITPQSVSSTFDPRCTLHQWLVFPLGGSTEFFADAAFPSLRAHAAEKMNSQFGLLRTFAA